MSLSSEADCEYPLDNCQNLLILRDIYDSVKTEYIVKKEVKKWLKQSDLADIGKKLNVSTVTVSKGSFRSEGRQ